MRPWGTVGQRYVPSMNACISYQYREIETSWSKMKTARDQDYSSTALSCDHIT